MNSKKKKRQYVNQHFIPECYLKGFTFNDKNLYVYDKKKESSFRTSINNIAYKEFFYTIPTFYLKESDPPISTNHFETNFFADFIEYEYKTMLQKVKDSCNQWLIEEKGPDVFTDQERELFSYLIAIQYLRMPRFIKKYAHGFRKGLAVEINILKAMIAAQKPELKNEVNELKVEYDPEYDPVLHASLYTNFELLHSLTSLISEKIWIFQVVKEDYFYSSDSPIVIQPHLKNEPERYEGFGMKGGEIVLPLSSKVVLNMWDKDVFEKKAVFDNKFCNTNGVSQRRFNCLQYIFAQRQVYSFSNNFKLISDLKGINGGKEMVIKKSEILVNGK